VVGSGVEGRDLGVEVEDLGEPVSGAPSRATKKSPISACQRALTSVVAMPAWAAARSSVSR